MPGLKYGDELPDQVEVLNTVVENQLALLSDIRELIKDRAALEKEYAGKLQAIARKAAEKRARTAAPRIVGNDPVKAYGEDVFKRNTLETVWAMLIEAYDTSSQDHASLSESLTAQTAQDLKNLEGKKDASRRKQLAAFQKVLADRDKVYNERLRAKQKYDEECVEIETYRQKQGRAADDKHADRAARQYEQQKTEMLNAKNIFITSIAVSNKVKDKFYSVDLPALENQFQEIQASLTTGVVSILKAHQHLQTSTLEGLRYKLNLVDTTIAAFDATKDQDLFIEFNKRPGFVPPGDWEWEPCATYYDSGGMSVEPEPKVFLQNKLARASAKLEEVKTMEKAKSHEAAQLRNVFVSYQNNPKLGDADEVMNNCLEAEHAAMQLQTSQCALEAEIEVLLEALGGDEGARQPHTFKSSSFSIPTPCGLCKSSIWGLSKQGKTCKSCGLSVHAKCELKVPAECPGSASSGKKHRTAASLSMARSGAGASTSSRLSISTVESVAPTPTASAFGQPSSFPTHQGTILFDFTASSPFELSVTEGAVVEVLELDDGSGWVKIGDANGEKGLVPATYVQLMEDGAQPMPGAGTIKGNKPQGSGRYVKGLYEYQAQGDDEISIKVGGKIELTAVGESYGDGWSEGIDASGKKGIFPTNYVEAA